jgi:hypothetical protein
MPCAEQQKHEHHKGEEKTAENLLAWDAHFTWLIYSSGIL